MTKEAGAIRPRTRRAILIAAGVAAGLAVAAWVAVRVLRHGSASGTADPIDTDRYLRPLETRADPGTGEQVAPFSGFAVSVETEPEGALVTIAGVERGESPVLAGVECKPGAKVPIRVTRRGFRTVQAATLCRSDALVKLTVRLSR
jgi:hypothetical protein